MYGETALSTYYAGGNDVVIRAGYGGVTQNDRVNVSPGTAVNNGSRR